MPESISAYPFYIFGKDWANAMQGKSYPNKGDVIVDKDVWLGYNANIMAGVTIREGAIIAANSTVVKDVEPYAIVGGNPARQIKKRFSNETIKKLLEIKLWDWELECITANVQNLADGNIENLK